VKLTWSNLAKGELQELRRSSIQRWGRGVAQLYLEDVRDAAKQLSVDPLRETPLKGLFRILRMRSHYLTAVIDVSSDPN